VGGGEVCFDEVYLTGAGLAYLTYTAITAAGRRRKRSDSSIIVDVLQTIFFIGTTRYRLKHKG